MCVCAGGGGGGGGGGGQKFVLYPTEYICIKFCQIEIEHLVNLKLIYRLSFSIYMPPKELRVAY